MVIKEILEELETKNHPVAKALHVGKDFKVLIIAFKKAMVLKEHKTSLNTKLTVLNGRVTYDNGTKKVILNQYDEYIIPIDEVHSVTAIDDALCLLTQGFFLRT